MNALPFAQPGRFYRGNLHLHSTNSDGRRSPGETLQSYRERGYDFVSLTDHFLPDGEGNPPSVSDVQHLNDASFVTIPGAEIHGPGLECGEYWHIVANGLPLDFPWLREGETGPEVAARAHAAGAVISIAHPHWNTVTLNDAATVLPYAHAVEVYNHGCEMEVQRGESWHFADCLLQAGHRLNAIATDDAHFGFPGNPEGDAFGGWVMVKAASLTPDALLAALHAGHYYSSTGPEIHDVTIEGDIARVLCSPAEAIILSGAGSRSERRQPGPVESGEFPLKAFLDAGWFRITVRAEDGTSAWTNPIWL